jgi:hypothetical protein
MLTKQGVAITFYAFFVNSTDLDGETGLTVTIDIYEATTGAPIVSGGSATELAGGLYYYTLASGSVDNDGAYTAIFKTASADVVQKWLPALWQVGTTLKAVDDVTTTATATTVTNGVTLADDAITSAKFDESSAFPIAAADSGNTYIARTGADSDTLEDISDEIAALNNLSAAQVWAYATRTLTENIGNVTVISAVSGSTVTVYANDTWSFTVTDTSLDTDAYEVLAFVVKDDESDSDDEAMLYLRSDTGLVRINAAAPTDAANGSLTYATTSFTVLVAITETAISSYGDYTWWLKGFDTTPATDTGFTLATGTFAINRPGLQAVT